MAMIDKTQTLELNLSEGEMNAYIASNKDIHATTFQNSISYNTALLMSVLFKLDDDIEVMGDDEWFELDMSHDVNIYIDMDESWAMCIFPVINGNTVTTMDAPTYGIVFK